MVPLSGTGVAWSLPHKAAWKLSGLLFSRTAMGLLFRAVSDLWSVCQHERADRTKAESLVFTLPWFIHFLLRSYGGCPSCRGLRSHGGGRLRSECCRGPAERQELMHSLVSLTLWQQCNSFTQGKLNWTKSHWALNYIPGAGLGAGYRNKRWGVMGTRGSCPSKRYMLVRQTQTKPKKVKRSANFKMTNDIECSMETRCWDGEWGNIR